MNNFTKKQAKEILPILKKAVQLQNDVWNILGDLEGALRCDCDGMDEALHTLTVDGAGAVTVEDALRFINALERYRWNRVRY